MVKQKIYLVIISLCIFQLSFGQKKEFYANAYAGLFSFRGNSADNTSSIVHWSPPYTPYNPNDINSISYGTRSGFSYSLEVQGQFISKDKNMVGLRIGYERLTSQVFIDKIINAGDPAYFIFPAQGKVNQTFSFINLSGVIDICVGIF